MIEETNASGAVVSRYTQTQNIDEPLAMLRSSTTSYYNADGLGSVTSLTNSAGAAAQTYTYDSFGTVTASSGSLTNPFQYTGRESDSETGLYYYRARYYDPTLGRFIGEDPTGFDAGSNFYTYVVNMPTQLVDPLGLDPNCTNGLKPLVLDDVQSYINTPPLGTGTCVDFLKKTMGNYPTKTWVKGPAPDKNTPLGTFVATFHDNNGTKYASQSGIGHVGAWYGFYAQGIVLIDQYDSRNAINPSRIPWGGTRNYNNNASNYFIVLVPCN